MKNTLPVLRKGQAGSAALQRISEDPVSALKAAFYAGRNERTVKAYQNDLEHFKRFMGADSVDLAIVPMLTKTSGEVNAIALAYRSDMQDQGLAPASINRRLAALRSIFKLARILGLVQWTVEVEGVRGKSYRDTRGPGLDGVQKLIDLAMERHDPKGKRDRAIVRLLFDMALRRGEAVSLDLSDIDLKRGTLSVIGKGRTEKELLTIPDQTREALREWIGCRGEWQGPLFVNFDHAGKGERLTGQGVERIIKALGMKALGHTVNPHGLRHAAITEALDCMAGDVRSVQRFSRHKDIRTLSVYDDNRRDLGGEVAKKVAASVSEK
jgi:integrase/recombinase XerC